MSKAALLPWLALALVAGGCAQPPKADPSPDRVESVPDPRQDAEPKADAEEDAPDGRETELQPDAQAPIVLRPNEPTTVADGELTLELVSTWHKSRAPVVGFEVRFTAGDHVTEVGWRIEEGEFDDGWRAVEGRYYNAETSQYVEDAIAGWEVKMISLDESDVGGSPEVVTITVRRAE